ncbi:MAG: IS66 family transposase [candidate division NC10 bacterium]|nr:IS66 family transposase [candidate division NC10 bacterium]
MEIDRKNLPKDPETLRQMVASLLEELDAKERRLQRVQHLLEKLLRWRYGPRRERVPENQLFLFAVGMVGTDQDLPPAPKEAAASKPKGPGHGRQRLPGTLERRRVVYDLGEEERRCPECHGELKPIGEEVSERLEYVPASLYVIEEACQKYACRQGCTVVTAPKPMRPIEKGLPGPGLLAQVAVSKYGDHLPLHRQEGIYQRQGVTLSRKTMGDWMRQCAELVEPLFDRMKQRALESKVMQTDDTPVGVLDLALPRTRTGRIWTYVGDAAHPYTVYDYTANRSRDGPEAFLKEFSGFLQADAYSGYDALYKDRKRDVREVACWAHARRKFYEAQSSDVMRSMVLLAYIRLLYDVEREARDLQLNREGRLALRQARSVPILKDIQAYLQRERSRVLPKSPEGHAIAYALSNWKALVRYCESNWKALVRYCEDGDLEIDNNGAERSLRGVAVGRKNWMFFGSDNGGRTAAILTSFITTCKRLHIDPFVYLRDIFERIGTHPDSRLDELLPDQWKTARGAVTS